MREIKFRGKRKDTGKWVYGYYFASCGKSYIIRDDKLPLGWDGKYYEDLGANTVEVIPETVGQDIDVRDKKRTKAYPEGQEIFEGDEVSSGFWGGTIQFKDGGFKICEGLYNQSTLFRSVEVIGNIHTTPERPCKGAQ